MEQPFEGRKWTYVSGVGKLPNNTPSRYLHEVISLGIIVDSETHEILDVSCTLATDMAREAIKRLLLGKHLTGDFESLSADIRARYFGYTKNAIIAGLKDARKRYLKLVLGREEPATD